MIKHPEFWFDDGSVLVVTGETMYKLHRSLIVRFSPRFFDRCCQSTKVPSELSADSSTPCYSLRDDSNISQTDFNTLVAYITHDMWVNRSASNFRTYAQCISCSARSRTTCPSKPCYDCISFPLADMGTLGRYMLEQKSTWVKSRRNIL